MDQKNLILAIAVSLAILLGFEYFVAQPNREKVAEQQATQQAADTSALAQNAAAPAGQATAPGAAASGTVAPAAAASADVGPRLEIDTPTLTGSISLVGGRVDELILRQYHTTVDPESPNIVLLQPPGSSAPYYADFGWSAAAAGVAVPGPDSRWTVAQGDVLSPGHPVVLEWDNGEGLVFRRKLSIDDEYMFTVDQEVENRGQQEVTLSPYGLISRTGTPKTLGYFILHEGFVGVFNGTLHEEDYGDVADAPNGTITLPSKGGWLGITDKYWMAALVPDQQDEITGRFVHTQSGGQDKYQTDFIYGQMSVAPGATVQQTSRLFAGAKVVTVLDDYRDRLGIDRFDLAVDFGWFYFLTKPMFKALHWIHGEVGNFGIAIMILTVCVKLLFFPLANKSYRSMAKLRKLQPEMQRLRERYGDDKQRFNQELMALYKKEKANPAAGCWPVVIQIPVFFSLYKVLFVTIEMRHAPFFGWIHDLSAPDPTSWINLFGLLPYHVPDLGPLHIISIGAWPLLMGISMFLQQRLNPQPADPTQARIFMLMPVIFTFFLGSFPAGLVIYWTWNNTLSILQQYVIMKRAGAKIGGKADPMPSFGFGKKTPAVTEAKPAAAPAKKGGQAKPANKPKPARK